EQPDGHNRRDRRSALHRLRVDLPGANSPHGKLRDHGALQPDVDRYEERATQYQRDHGRRGERGAARHRGTTWNIDHRTEHTVVRFGSARDREHSDEFHGEEHRGSSQRYAGYRNPELD